MVAPFEVRCELTLSGPPCPAVAAEGAAAVALFDEDVEEDEAEAAGAADSDAIGVAEAGALDATGVAEAAGVALFVFEELRATTTRAKITIPTITAITTRDDDFALEASFLFPTRAASLFTLPVAVTGLFKAAGTDAPGVREYEFGTGGITIDAAVDALAELRFVAFFADLRTAFLVAFFAVFLTTRLATFLADDFLAVVFFADFFTAFLTADFFAVFLTAFLADFFAVFLTATFAPFMTSYLFTLIT